ncbi:MAG: pitrilysin family protein [Planctomycetota bacterium]|nr:pitrilysin family protein [Planctomycetota bacterium]
MRTKLLLATLVLLIAAAAPAHAKEAIAHEKYQLANGLTVILHENKKLPQVVVNLWYHCGTREEPAGRSGFAHLFEHLMFMGTKRVPGNQFDVLMESGGGSNNASTWFDRTDYYSWGPARILPTLLWLEADRMEGLAAAMTQEKLDLQRDVVRNERREGYDNAPYGPSEYLFWQLMYPTDHPYHFHVIGSHADLVAATVEDVVSFHQTYYVPNNATLVVAGDFETKQVKQLIEGLFGSIPRGKQPPRRSAPAVGFDRVERVLLKDKVQFPRITMAWHTPAYYREGDAEMDLIAFALTSGKNGRLYRRLVREEQLAVDVSSWQTSLRLGSVFRIDCYAKPGADLDRIEAIIDEELRRMHAEGPTERELVRARADLETSTWAELESLRNVADRLNHYDAYLGRPDAVAWDLKRYEGATVDGVRAWSRKSLRLDRRLVLRVLPAAKPQTELPSRDRRPSDLSQREFTPPVPAAPMKLSNGLTLWHVRRPGIPLVAARLLLHGGSLAVPRGQAGASSLAADMLLEGAGERDALAFADALDGLGASLSVDAGRSGTTLSLRVLRRNADAAFALLGEALRAPRFDNEAFERQRSLHLEGLRGLLDDPGELARRAGTEAYYGDRAYGVPVDGYPTSVRALTLEQVRAHHDRWHTPSGSILLTAGDLTAAEVRALAEKHLGNWKDVSPRPAISHDAPPVHEKLRVVIVERAKAEQTVIRFVHPGVGFQHEDRVGLQVLNTLFGGSFTSRLNANLRETHGYTYGAWSVFAMMGGRGLFVASANVQTAKTGASLREFLGEFDRIRKGGITSEEALKAREGVRSEVVQSFESLDGTLGAYAAFARYGVPPDRLPRDLQAAGALQPATLDGLAKAHLARGGGVLVLVGDVAAIRSQLQGLGLSEPRVLTAEQALAGHAGR